MKNDCLEYLSEGKNEKKRKRGEQASTENVGTSTAIALSNVPEFLKRGVLYQSLSAGSDPSDDLITISGIYYKDSETVHNRYDLERVLSCLRYWAVDEMPASVIKYVMEHNLRTSERILEEYAKNFPVLVTLLDVQPLPPKSRLARIESIECALPIVRYLHQCGFTITDEIAVKATSSGNVGFLKCFESDFKCEPQIMFAAVISGQLDCVKYLQRFCPLIPLHLHGAAQQGHLECMQYISRHVEAVREDLCRTAAYYGKLNCLEFAHTLGCPWSKAVTDSAAGSGHLDCLQYAREHGCEWHSDTLLSAIKYNHLPCVLYALQLGCPVADLTMGFTARQGHLECLQRLHEHGILWDEVTPCMAAKYDHVECLMYAHTHGCPITAATYKYAVKNDSSACITYLDRVGLNLL